MDGHTGAHVTNSQQAPTNITAHGYEGESGGNGLGFRHDGFSWLALRCCALLCPAWLPVYVPAIQATTNDLVVNPCISSCAPKRETQHTIIVSQDADKEYAERIHRIRPAR
jgi:hypothetical protein